MEKPSLTDAFSNGSAAEPVECPQCGSKRFYKDGLRYNGDGRTTQRWLCRDCGLRFSEKGPLQENPHWQINTAGHYASGRQVCDLAEESKNLAEVNARQEQAQREGTAQTADVKGKILEHAWQMHKIGRSKVTVAVWAKTLKTLVNQGADLTNPERVFETIAKHPCANTKRTRVAVYKSFANFHKIPITYMPRYNAEPKQPFIPMEREIDDLIACSPKRTAAVLQLLKETGMRIGEALNLSWIDLDCERKVVRVTPEKGSYARTLPLSDRLLGVLNGLPKKNQKIFGAINSVTAHTCFHNTRKKAASKLQNLRLLQITFHTLRHWKGTMEYHKTHDPYHVKKLLGHKSIRSTEIYINIENALFNERNDEFHFAAAKTIEEAGKLITVGFEYVCHHEGAMLFRKRK